MDTLGDDARKQAAVATAKQQQAIDGPKAMAEYVAAGEQARQNMARLRALRLEREARTSQKHPNTQRVGGPGTSHENRREPEKSKPHAERDTPAMKVHNTRGDQGKTARKKSAGRAKSAPRKTSASPRSAARQA